MQHPLLLAAILPLAGASPARVSLMEPEGTRPGRSFISYSIELSSFPDFAGNKSNPNIFSDNLLNNLGNIAGTKPYVRVGGNTQDYALYNASLKTSINGTYVPGNSKDYPTIIYIGPSFFESYQTWPGVRFSHGFNLAKGGAANNSEGWQTLLDTAPLACKAIGKDAYYGWEYGNEPNNFMYPGHPRPRTWGPKEFTYEWLNGTKAIAREMKKHCPDMGREYRQFMAPSYDDRVDNLNATQVWQLGLDRCDNINTYSVHK